MVIDHVKFTSNKEVTSESPTQTILLVDFVRLLSLLKPWYLKIVL